MISFSTMKISLLKDLVYLVIIASIVLLGISCTRDTEKTVTSQVVDDSTNKQVGDYLQVGDRFEFGRYPQGANGEVKPIIWRVLRRDDDGLLVVSEQALEAKPYDKEYVFVTWSGCTLRRWLNGEFLKVAFNDKERSLIKTSILSNDIGPDTEDHIFLLSVDEVKSLFSGDNRISKSTDYAIKNGLRTKKAWWWLRSCGDNVSSAAYAYSFGDVNYYDDYVRYSSGAVCPAFKIAFCVNDGGTVERNVTPSEIEDDSIDIQSLRVICANKRVGDRLEFGHYPQSSNGEIESISWRVLRRDDNTLLIISEYGLDFRRYNEECASINWADCTLRRWLNDEFLERAFNTQERALIKMSNLSNDTGPDTEDRVFLLSVEEVKSLFSGDNDRVLRLTDYASKKYEATNNAEKAWWLRSRGDDYNDAAYIDSEGGIDYDYDFNLVIGVIRPALQITLDE